MSKDKRVQTNLMTEGSVWKSILFFSVPLILGNLLQQMYNTVDSIIVGNCVGDSALAAVGSSSSLIYLLIAFSQGASVGAGIVVSQFLGAEERENVQDAVHTALAVSVLFGIVLTAAGILFTPQLLAWMKTPSDVMEESVLYLKIYSGGLIFNIIYNMAAGILNAVGNSKRSLLYLAAASVVNIGLDLLLISGLKMGVSGAALATDISQAVSCVLSLVFLMRVQADYRVSLRRIRFKKAMVVKIVRIGLPAGIQNMVISLSNVIMQSGINSFGKKAMAGFSAYMKIDGFNILPVLSFSMAVTTFVGQNFGAGNKERMKKGMWVTLVMGLIYTIVTGVLLLAFASQIVGLFNKDAQVIRYGVLATRYFCPFYFILSILHGLAGTVRGTGRTIPPMVILLASLCIFRIAAMKIIVPHFDTIDSIYILYPISWLIGAVLMVLYVWKGKWQEHL
ncbi:MAG: MATE family efflux transporter [Eubacteriales Family XIII. Incertae Sedis bacterium]|nr:MAG: MATE family efflux transporter [Clostridiales Family XIII bacterium]